MAAALEQQFLLETAIYPREAILRACYWLEQEAAIALAQPQAGTIEVTLSPKAGQDPVALRAKFDAALIDFAVRIDVEQRTGDLRDRIWRVAFAETTGHSAGED